MLMSIEIEACVFVRLSFDLSQFCGLKTLPLAAYSWTALWNAFSKPTAALV